MGRSTMRSEILTKPGHCTQIPCRGEDERYRYFSTVMYFRAASAGSERWERHGRGLRLGYLAACVLCTVKGTPRVPALPDVRSQMPVRKYESP